MAKGDIEASNNIQSITQYREIKEIHLCGYSWNSLNAWTINVAPTANTQTL